MMLKKATKPPMKLLDQMTNDILHYTQSNRVIPLWLKLKLTEYTPSAEPVATIISV